MYIDIVLRNSGEKQYYFREMATVLYSNIKTVLLIEKLYISQAWFWNFLTIQERILNIEKLSIRK